VFAGQTVEHMWLDDLASFLCEAHRVLGPDGVLVMDSPNRRVSMMLEWFQPQHTAEFNVHEIVAMPAAAGFDRIDVRGVWLCYGREEHVLLPFDPAVEVRGWPWRRRVALSAGRPEDCFTWWLEARKNPAATPDHAAVAAIARKVYDEAFPQYVAREFVFPDLRPEGWGRNRVFKVPTGRTGCVAYGPYVPLGPGRYVVRFGVGRLAAGPIVPPDAVVCEFDIIVEAGKATLTRRQVRASELPAGELGYVEVPFDLKETGFGLEFRIFSTGVVPLVFRARRELIDVGHLARAFAG